MNRTFQFPTDNMGTPSAIPSFTGYTTANRGRIWTSTFIVNDITNLNPSLGTTPRPIQYSEWGQLYNRFYIKGWTARVKLMNNAVAGSETAAMQNKSVLISVFSNSSNAPLSPTANYRWSEEQDLMKATRKLRYRLLRTKPDHQTQPNPVQTMVVKDSSKRLARLEGVDFNDMVGIMGTTPISPAKLFYHHIMVRQPYVDATATSSAIRLEVSYTFDVLMMDPKTMNPTLE